MEFSTVKNNITKLRKDGFVQDTGEIEGQQRKIELTEAGLKYVDDYLSRHAAEKRHGVTPPIRDRERDDASEESGREVPEDHGHRPGERCIHDVPGRCWLCKRKTSEDGEEAERVLQEGRAVENHGSLRFPAQLLEDFDDDPS